MAKLTGQAALEWIKKNPKKGYTITKGANLSELLGIQDKRRTSYGFLGNILEGIANPFVGAIEKVGEGTSAISRGQLGDFLSGDEDYQTRFMDQGTYEDIGNNMGWDIAQDIAGIGATLLPAGWLGKGLLGAVGTGALAGGLGAFSQTDLEDPLDAGQILGGAATGGVLGGAFNLGGKALGRLGRGGKKAGKLTNIADELQSQNLVQKFDPKTGLGGKQARQEALKDVMGQLKEYGLGVTDRNVNKLRLGLDAQLDDILLKSQQAAKKINYGTTDDIINEILKGAKIGANEAQTLTPNTQGFIVDLAEQIQATGGDTVRSRELMKAFSGRDIGANVAEVSNPRAIAEAARQVLSKGIKKSVPAAEEVLSKMSPIYKIQDEVVRTANLSGQVPVPFAGKVRTPVPLGNLLRGGISRGLRLVDDKLVSPLGSPTAQTLGSFAQSPNVAKALGLGAGFNQEDKAAGINSLGGQPFESGNQMNQQDAVMMYQELLAQGYNNAEAKQIMALSGVGQARNLNERQAKWQTAAETSKKALDLLDSGLVGTGPQKYLTGGIQNLFGIKSNEQVEYESAVALAATAAKNAMLGSAMTPTEQASLQPYIPEITDPPNVARQKLATFYELALQFSQT